VVRVLAAFCLQTGAVLDCTLGSLKTSEQALTAVLLTGPWLKSLFVGDRNFGVMTVRLNFGRHWFPFDKMGLKQFS
jgi:hypothetical protein